MGRGGQGGKQRGRQEGLQYSIRRVQTNERETFGIERGAVRVGPLLMLLLLLGRQRQRGELPQHPMIR